MKRFFSYFFVFTAIAISAIGCAETPRVTEYHPIAVDKNNCAKYDDRRVGQVHGEDVMVKRCTEHVFQGDETQDNAFRMHKNTLLTALFPDRY